MAKVLLNVAVLVEIETDGRTVEEISNQIINDGCGSFSGNLRILDAEYMQEKE